MGINTKVIPLDNLQGRHNELDQSIVDRLSKDTYFAEDPISEDRDRDSDFEMKSNSRASSRTSATEVFVDGDGEEENENDDVSIIENNIDPILETSEQESEKALSIGSLRSTRLRWSTLTIREYPRVLGDNITVMGPPISLAWTYQDERVFPLEEYEKLMVDNRRTQSELKMPSAFRDQILKESGYSRHDIQEAIKKSNIARNQRKRTVEMLKMQPLHEVFEKVVRVGKNPLRKKKKDLYKVE